MPLPIDNYTTSCVLTMDFIRGTKITVVGGVERTEFDGKALADDLFRAYLQQILCGAKSSTNRRCAGRSRSSSRGITRRRCGS